MPRRQSHLKTADQPPQLKRIVVSFLVAVVAIVLMVLYYSLAHATITITAGTSSEVKETSLTVNGSGDGGALRGAIAQTELEQSRSFTASASGAKVDKATGSVALVNTGSQAQALIATTRLLSGSGVLFRLKTTVTVPARGKLTNVLVEADQPGDASEIPAGKFTIPGLRPSLRDKIYAESTEPMRRAEKPSNKVTALDLEQARKTLGDALVPQALGKLREQLPPAQRTWTVVYQADTTQGSSDVPAGTAKSNFTYRLKAKVTAVFYDPTSLREQALAKLQDDVQSGRKIVTIEEQSLAVALDSASPDLKTASLKVKLLAQVTVTDPDQAYDKKDLQGRTPEEVKNYFSNVPGVQNADVELSPFWVKTVPTVESHIVILLKQ